MTQHRILPFDAVDEPEPGMLYSDRLGPWVRLGRQDGQLPGRGFLIAYHSSAAAVGRLAEDLLCQVVLLLLASFQADYRQI